MKRADGDGFWRNPGCCDIPLERDTSPPVPPGAALDPNDYGAGRTATEAMRVLPHRRSA